MLLIHSFKNISRYIGYTEIWIYLTQTLIVLALHFFHGSAKWLSSQCLFRLVLHDNENGIIFCKSVLKQNTDYN